MSALTVGDVIVFAPPDQTQAVMHRITSMNGGAITTKGDANSVADPWVIRLAGTTAYRLVGAVPLVGWLRQFTVPALLLAGLLAGLATLRWLWKEVMAKRLRSQPQSQL